MPSDQVMSEWGKGQLHSGSKTGPIVSNRKQAIAILLSEKRKEGNGGFTKSLSGSSVHKTIGKRF